MGSAESQPLDHQGIPGGFLRQGRGDGHWATSYQRRKEVWKGSHPEMLWAQWGKTGIRGPEGLGLLWPVCLKKLCWPGLRSPPGHPLIRLGSGKVSGQGPKVDGKHVGSKSSASSPAQPSRAVCSGTGHFLFVSSSFLSAKRMITTSTWKSCDEEQIRWSIWTLFST